MAIIRNDKKSKVFDYDYWEDSWNFINPPDKNKDDKEEIIKSLKKLLSQVK